MMKTRVLSIAGVAVISWAAVHAPAVAAARRCTMRPGSSHVLIAIERDTLLPLVTAPRSMNSASGVRPGAGDSLLADASTLMPSARVTLLRTDSATRHALETNGITAAQPAAIIQAQPYRADCRTIRYTDTTAWVRAGEHGYARATLAPRAAWPGNDPVFVIMPTWDWPYPQQTGALPAHLREFTNGTVQLKPGISAATFASAEAMFEVESIVGDDRRYVPVDALVSWAKANIEHASREPLRTRIVSGLVGRDWEAVSAAPSRFRGTYRVTMASGEISETWMFRTVDRPSYADRDAEQRATVAEILDTPHVLGYSLVAHTADSSGALPSVPPRPVASRERSLVWLRVGDRPTAAQHRDASMVPGEVEFTKLAAPRSLWRALTPFVPEMDALSRDFFARTNTQRTEAQDQPKLPVTLRIGSDGQVRGDTTLVRDGVTLRLTIVRTDTIAVLRVR
jgi:hypothetical protein